MVTPGVPEKPVVELGPSSPGPSTAPASQGGPPSVEPVPTADSPVAGPAAAPTPAASDRPYELPADFQAPQAPLTPQGTITDPERIQLEYFRRREQEHSLQDQERALDDYQNKATQFYINEGQDETTAKLLAQAHRTERQASLSRELALRADMQAQQRVSQEAMEVARQFNVNPSVLAGFQRREDMARYAGLVRYFGDYRKNTEQRLAALEKARVPDQPFAGGGGTGGVVGKSYGDRLKDTGPQPTAAERDRMTAKYLTG